MYKDIERILCAAIHYPELAVGGPHRPRNIVTGIVVCGHRHHDCISTFSVLTKMRSATQKSVQGFLTSKNRFVDREEGWKIAQAAWQLKDGIVRDRTRLHSEDIY